MARTEPVTELDPRFSAPDAKPDAWRDVQTALERAEVSWLSTVTPDGHPHVTPLISVWIDDTAYFCTGPSERKAKNLERNPHVILTTGWNVLDDGLDVVVEGDARVEHDETVLRRIADEFEDKYGSDWHFGVRAGVFVGDGGEALVFEVRPRKVFGFRKGNYAQTRWRFAEA
jgi:general stress protein 26